jgi:rRNA-processing protein FCF1
MSEITSFSARDVMNWLGSRGGRIGPEATSPGIADLQAQATSLGRVLRSADAAVADSAMQDGLSMITNDQKFAKFLRAINYPVEGY